MPFTPTGAVLRRQAHLISIILEISWKDPARLRSQIDDLDNAESVPFQRSDARVGIIFRAAKYAPSRRSARDADHVLRRPRDLLSPPHGRSPAVEESLEGDAPMNRSPLLALPL